MGQIPAISTVTFSGLTTDQVTALSTGAVAAHTFGQMVALSSQIVLNSMAHSTFGSDTTNDACHDIRGNHGVQSARR